MKKDIRRKKKERAEDRTKVFILPSFFFLFQSTLNLYNPGFTGGFYL